MSYEEREQQKQDFYSTCAEILQTNHQYVPGLTTYRTRWNDRDPGNGRFPGFGTIRWFGPTAMHVASMDPPINRSFSSEQEVYDFLSLLKTP